MNNLMHLFVLRDQKLDCYLNPMFLQSRGQAIRLISDTIQRGAGKDDAPMVCSHPEDFELFFLGTFDATTARFSLLDVPESVCLCKDLVVKSN